MLPVRTLYRSSLGRKKARGCIYARFSTKFQASIEDQVRSCREWAAKHGVDVDDIHIYFDEAKTGKSRRRKGLQAMLAALDRGEIDVVITFATNRLNRKIHLALQFVEGQIVEKRRRCVFVAQNIDTENTQFWKQLLYVFAMLDEFQTQMSVAHIRAAHVGLLLKGHVHSTLTYGYTGTPIPGELTRQNKPRRLWAIDDATRPWVLEVFQWYLHERMRFRAIARRLRNEGAPPPPKVGRWSAGAVKYLLTNRRYIGDWSYGWTENVWQSEADYARQLEKDEPTHAHRREDLRIIDDLLFYKVQERVARKLGKGGRPTHGDRHLPDVLAEVLWCPKHGRRLSTRGANAQLLACPDCKAADAPEDQFLFSAVNRKSGLRQLCGELGKQILADGGVVEMAIEAAARHAAAIQSPDPARLAALERELSEINTQIAFVLDNPGKTATDRAENATVLAARREERARIQADIAQVRATEAVRKEVPADDELRALISEMGDILARAATSDDEGELGRAMSLVIDLTGGRVEMSQQGERKAKRGWLRGTFRLRLLGALLGRAGCGTTGEEGVELRIDFREPTEAEDLADDAKALWDRGMLVKEIAVELTKDRGEPVSRNSVKAAIRTWFTSRGLPVPDGRSRRATLAKKSIDPTVHVKIADAVRVRFERGDLYEEIAEELGIDRNTVTAAVAHWHAVRGLSVPDGRSRRRGLARKSRLPESGATHVAES